MIFYYASSRQINSSFGQNSPTFSAPATWYIGLSTTIPLAGGTNITEPTIGNAGYARVAIPNDSSHFSAATTNNNHNLMAISFPKSLDSWGIITSVVFWDASTNGNAWFWDNFTTPRTIGESEILTFDPGAIIISVNNNA